MSSEQVFDSDVLIDFLRGQADAVAYFETLTGPLLVSPISVSELYAGVPEGTERAVLDGMLDEFAIVPVDAEIAIRGGLFKRAYAKSHNLALPDCLIAATAASRGASLVTLNAKHFPMLPDVLVPYRNS